MQSHEIDYEIMGDDIQIIEVELDPGEVVIAEAGAMNYMEDGITFEARMGDGTETDNSVMGKLLGAGKRVLTGESIFMTHFKNSGISGKKRVAFSAPYPGKILPINLDKLGGDLLCQKDAFLCAALGTQVSIAFNKRLGTRFFRSVRASSSSGCAATEWPLSMPEERLLKKCCAMKPCASIPAVLSPLLQAWTTTSSSPAG